MACSAAGMGSIMCRRADSCNVGAGNDSEDRPSYAAAMQSTTTSKEAPMIRKHLTRLTVSVVTASIMVAMFTDVALAGYRGW